MRILKNSQIAIVDSTNTPLGVSGVFTSSVIPTQGYNFLVGTCIADQNGQFAVQFSMDNVNYDGNTETPYTANDPLAFKILLMAPYCRVSFTNGAIPQGIFRISWGLQTSTV